MLQDAFVISPIKMILNFLLSRTCTVISHGWVNILVSYKVMDPVSKNASQTSYNGTTESLTFQIRRIGPRTNWPNCSHFPQITHDMQKALTSTTLDN